MAESIKAKTAGTACPITCKVIAVFPYALLEPSAVLKHLLFTWKKANAFPSEPTVSSILHDLKHQNAGVKNMTRQARHYLEKKKDFKNYAAVQRTYVLKYRRIDS